MRDIKFRAWNGKGFDYDIAVINGSAWKEENPTGDDVIDKNGRHYYTDWAKYNKKDWPIVQFTGVTNNDGDELYEGDVIDIQGHAATICCENSYREFYFWCEICNEYMGLAFLIGYKSFKIIGNIYENPELIGDS